MNPEPDTPTQRSGWRFLADPGRLALGLALLVSALAFLRAFDVLLGSDVRNYLVEARRIEAEGISRLFSGQAVTAPGFPLFLALARTLFGPTAPFLANAALLPLMFWLAWRWYRDLLGGPAAALTLATLAWILFCGSPVHPTYLVHPFREPLALTLSFGALALLNGPRERSPLRAMASALCLLTGVAVRENLLLLAPGMILWLLLDPRIEPPLRRRRGAAFCLPFLLLGGLGLAALLLRGAWSSQTAHVLTMLKNQAAHGKLLDRLAAEAPTLLDYTWGQFGWLLVPVLIGALLACGRGRLWTLTLALVAPQAALVLLFGVFPRYTMFTLVWLAPCVGIAAGALFRRLPATQSRSPGRWLPPALTAAGFVACLVFLVRLPASGGFATLRDVRVLLDELRGLESRGVRVLADLRAPAVANLAAAYLDLVAPPDSATGAALSGIVTSSCPANSHLRLWPDGVFPADGTLLLTGKDADTRAVEWLLPASLFSPLPAPVMRRADLSLQAVAPAGASAVTLRTQNTDEGPGAGEHLLWLDLRGAPGLPIRLSSATATGAGWQAELPARPEGHPAWRVIALPAGVLPSEIRASTASPGLLPADHHRAVLTPEGQWIKMLPAINPATWNLFYPGARTDKFRRLAATRGQPALTADGAELALPGVQGWTSAELGVSLLCSARRMPGESPPAVACEWNGVRLEPVTAKTTPDEGDTYGVRLSWRIPVSAMPERLLLRFHSDDRRLRANPLRVRRLDVRWGHLPSPVGIN